MKMVQEEIRKFIDTHDAPIIPVSSQNTIDAFQHCTNSLTALNMASPSLIKYYIKTRNNKKSSGYDGIPNFFLIKTVKQVHWCTYSIDKSLLQYWVFPQSVENCYRRTNTKKRKPPDSPPGCRQISLLSCISKIYEKFLLEKVVDHCEEFKIIPEN